MTFLRGIIKPDSVKDTSVSALPCSSVASSSDADGPVWFQEKTLPCGESALTGVELVLLYAVARITTHGWREEDGGGVG